MKHTAFSLSSYGDRELIELIIELDDSYTWESLESYGTSELIQLVLELQ